MTKRSTITRELVVTDDLSALDAAVIGEPVTPDPDFVLPPDEHITDLGGGLWFLGTDRALAIARATWAGKEPGDAEH